MPDEAPPGRGTISFERPTPPPARTREKHEPRVRPFLWAAAYVLISWTLARAEASLVALFVYLQPVIATILGVCVAGEQLTLRTVVGALFIFAGVYLALGVPRPPGLRRAAPAS